MLLAIDGRHLPLEALEDVALHNVPVEITDVARNNIARARESVERQYALGAAIYGVTTGFGRMANVLIAPHETEKLQENLVRSHAAGTGAPLSVTQVRAAGVLRIRTLAAGHSGVRSSTVDLLTAMLNHDVTPYVPSQGSVGASGDLAPLAHMTLTLIGEGKAYYDG